MAENIDNDFEDDEVRESVIPENEVVSDLLKKVEEATQKSAEIRGVLKHEYDSAKDKGLNAKAFKMFSQVMKIKSDMDRLEVVEHFNHYWNELGGVAQADLFDDKIGHNSNNVVSLT